MKSTSLNQKGSILIFTTIILVIVMVISFAILKIFLPKIRITTESINSAVAIYAADSGLEWCLFKNRIDTTLPPPIPPPPPILNQLNSISGVTIKYYSGNTEIFDCPAGAVINFRTVGTYRGIGRSLEIFQ